MIFSASCSQSPNEEVSFLVILQSNGNTNLATLLLGAIIFPFASFDFFDFHHQKNGAFALVSSLEIDLDYR